jgi:uncharacterized membrane protein YcaP (DUF421 family)
MPSIAAAVCRTAIVYFYLLTLMRLSGHRTIGNATPIDFVTALIIGDMVDGIFFNEIPVYQGLLCLSVVVLSHLLVRLGDFYFPAFYRLLHSTPTPFVRAGRWLPQGLRAERVNNDRVRAILRQEGHEDVEDVAFAQLECGGELSVQPVDLPLQRKDLKR